MAKVVVLEAVGTLVRALSSRLHLNKGYRREKDFLVQISTKQVKRVSHSIIPKLTQSHHNSFSNLRNSRVVVLVSLEPTKHPPKTL